MSFRCGGVCRWMGLAVLAALLACGDDGAAPPPEASYSLVVARGQGQRGLEGAVLRAPVVVRVLDGAGRKVSGVWVRFEVEAGGGEILDDASVTDENGEVLTFWRLGVPGSQAARARVDGGPSVRVDATALGVELADVVVVHGALGPLRGVLLVQETFDGMEVLEERISPDTVLRFAPIDEPGPRILLFPTDNRPLQKGVAWTPAPDTVHVTLQPPVPVDMVFAVYSGDFEEEKAVIRGVVQDTEELWKAMHFGLELGQVTFEDHTIPGNVVDVGVDGVCTGLVPGKAIRVAVVTLLQGGLIGGYGCEQGYVFLGESFLTFPTLLAHEVAHTFTLLHTTAGLMVTHKAGSGVRDGEIYRAHFNVRSTLNTIFGAQPEAERRECGNLGYTAQCLPMDYILGSTVGAPGPT